ncbi:hypothetical protein [Xanthomonas cerealis]|uniref:Uncharacterized protein n=1 Tax=Xanthomonas cerealis pv. cerealis TaxID=152263 RepID=A0A514EGA4_9XANT|nr:hypothetical protein [Xanthomonas translucens]QDI05054.1 hypothetical protein E4A48_16360 [Xanthomonas translucens pv. cerealis]UKE47095.1 hypothetical protein KHA79_18985 [Xanthomonas translucens pv. cerealis]
MSHFSIGYLSLVAAFAFPALYLLGYGVRYVHTWSKRLDPPKDRIKFFLIVSLVFGLLAGSVAQPLWDKAAACKASHQPLGVCLFFSGQN